MRASDCFLTESFCKKACLLFDQHDTSERYSFPIKFSNWASLVWVRQYYPLLSFIIIKSIIIDCILFSAVQSIQRIHFKLTQVLKSIVLTNDKTIEQHRLSISIELANCLASIRRQPLDSLVHQLVEQLESIAVSDRWISRLSSSPEALSWGSGKRWVQSSAFLGSSLSTHSPRTSSSNGINPVNPVNLLWSRCYGEVSWWMVMVKFPDEGLWWSPSVWRPRRHSGIRPEFLGPYLGKSSWYRLKVFD